MSAPYACVCCGRRNVLHVADKCRDCTEAGHKVHLSTADCPLSPMYGQVSFLIRKGRA